MQETEQELTEENLLIEVIELCEEGALERAFEVIQLAREVGWSDSVLGEMERVYSNCVDSL